LWEESTEKLYDEFLSAGFQARVSPIDLLSLDDSFLNRNLDQEFRQDLPEDIDVCGENGEYHSFVYNAPYFRSALKVECNEAVDRDFRPEIEMMIRSCKLELIS
jgi:diphthamide synthase (EF-2-diphthine--ammonia ligase)